MFLRTNGRWSIGHLCDENNKCACGWEYTPDEYTEVKELEKKPMFACNNCQTGKNDNSEVRWANVPTS